MISTTVVSSGPLLAGPADNCTQVSQLAGETVTTTTSALPDGAIVKPELPFAGRRHGVPGTYHQDAYFVDGTLIGYGPLRWVPDPAFAAMNGDDPTAGQEGVAGAEVLERLQRLGAQGGEAVRRAKQAGAIALILAPGPDDAIVGVILASKATQAGYRLAADKATRVLRIFRGNDELTGEAFDAAVKRLDDLAEDIARRTRLKDWTSTQTENTRKNAEILGVNLGVIRGSGVHAHHIIRGKGDAARRARDLLDKHQIDINSAINGVGLTRPEHYRKGLHSDDTMAEITRRLNATIKGIDDWGAARQKLIEELSKVGDEILNGTFP